MGIPPKLTARLGLGLAAAIFGIVGVIMLSRAAWLYLAVTIDPVSATAIEGGVFVVASAFLWLLARPSGASQPQAEPTPVESAAEANPWATLAGAFAEGMRAGRSYGGTR